MEPGGSTPTTWIDGSCSFRYLAIPDSVPPVPAPATKAVMRPSHCSQISGAVLT